MTGMLHFHDCSFTYPGASKAALAQVDLTLEQGQYLVILGVNGSGKSTLARLANGLLVPGSGTVEVDGLDSSRSQDQLAFHRKVALVTQDPLSQIINSTVEAELAFGPENLGLDPAEIRSRVDAALETVGLEGFQDRDPLGLSGGELQRLVLAAALTLEPDYLVLDEPASFLDADAGHRIRQLLVKLARSGRGIMHITHQLEDCLLADRVAVLSQGSLVFDGTRRELLELDDANWEAWGFRLQVSPLFQLARSLFKKGWELEPDSLDGAGIAHAIEAALGREVLSQALEQVPVHDHSHDHAGSGEGFRPHDYESESIPVALAGKRPLTDQVRADCLVLDQVSFTYPESDTPTLQDLQYYFEPGKVSLVLGTSGAGKSSLLGLAAGVLEPDQGQVTLKGTKVVPGSVGLVFQQAEGQFFARSVQEEVAFAARNKGLASTAEAQRQVAGRALEQVGLEPDAFLDRSPFTLSGGEARRVAIASVLSGEPAFICFDESNAGLDGPGLLDLQEVLATLKEQGRGIIIATHDLEAFLPLADEVLVLFQGKAVWQSSCQRLLAEPRRLHDSGLRLPVLMEAQGLLGRDPQALVDSLGSGPGSSGGPAAGGDAPC